MKQSKEINALKAIDLAQSQPNNGLGNLKRTIL